MLFTPAAIVTVSSSLQREKAPAPMFVTLEGMFTFVSPVQ